jgi:hypothetical protein
MSKKIPDLVRDYLAQIGREGGRKGGVSKSEKKIAAVTANLKKAGGRPQGAKDLKPRKSRKAR